MSVLKEESLDSKGLSALSSVFTELLWKCCSTLVYKVSYGLFKRR